MLDKELEKYFEQRNRFLQGEMKNLEIVLGGMDIDNPEYKKYYELREQYRKEFNDNTNTLENGKREEMKLELEQQKVDNDRNFKNGQLKNEKNETFWKVFTTTLQTTCITGFAWWMADYETNKERLVRSQSVQTLMRFFKIDKFL